MGSSSDGLREHALSPPLSTPLITLLDREEHWSRQRSASGKTDSAEYERSLVVPLMQPYVYRPTFQGQHMQYNS